jgi:hypothetical protein
MRQLTPLPDGMTHTEGARWHAGRFWLSDLYSERVCSMREDGTDLRSEMAVPKCPSGIGWLPDLHRANPLSAVLSTRVDIVVA